MTSSRQIILPGSTIGVLGSGQLGRMFAIAARRMGYRVHTYSPDSDTPTGQVADLEMKAPYEDLAAVRAFAKQVQVITYEFENIPFETSQVAAEIACVRPNGNVLHTTQHRVREKTFLSERGFPVAPFHLIRSSPDVEWALQKLGTPAILKTAGFGYDGKGQRRIKTLAEAQAAFQDLGGRECILEALIDFECEVSMIGARGADGSLADYGVIRNDHKQHILDVSSAPAELPESLIKEARRITQGILETLDVIGVLCVEFFLTKKGQLLVNELAPRPHNSGHLTVDACLTSQFEQQLRAVCGLPLGSTTYWQPGAMVNLLGERWLNGEPQWDKALADPNVKLHLYGKAEARPGRKMGHLTALAATPAEARRKVLAAREALAPC